MAEVVRYVNTDSTAGGDGTTNGTAGATRAYATLSEWESNEQADLVTATDTHVCYATSPSGVADTVSLNIDGWTTDATYFISLIGDNQGLVKDTSKYTQTRNIGADSWGTTIALNDPWTKLSGFQIDLYNATTGSDNHAFTGWAGGSEIFNCMAYSRDTRIAAARAVTGYNCSWGTELIVYNCSFARMSTGCIQAAQDGKNTMCYITAVDCWVGIDASYQTYLDADSHAKNNLAIDNDVDFGGSMSSLSDNYVGAQDYNAASDATAYGTNSIDNVSVTFEDAANDDYHLVSGDTDVIGFAGPRHSDAYHPISDDAEGNTRDQTAPDIGANEYVPFAPTSRTAMHPFAGIVHFKTADRTSLHPLGGVINGKISAVVQAQDAFRFGADDGSEAAHTWLAAQNVNISRAIGLSSIIRIQVDNTGDAPTQQMKIQVKKTSDADSFYRDIPVA